MKGSGFGDRGRNIGAIGWRENVGLPELGIAHMRAKVDTGARTSALHAEKQEVFIRDGTQWVRFRVPVQPHGKLSTVELPLKGRRDIKNTSGLSEPRLIVRTTLILGMHKWHIDLSLADRRKMEFDLILGRTAIRGRNVLVDPGKSYLAGPPRTGFVVHKPATQALDLRASEE